MSWLHVGAMLLAVGCGDERTPTVDAVEPQPTVGEAPPHVPTSDDPVLCAPAMGLTAETVAATGYDGRYTRYPSDWALARDAACARPAWRAGTRRCGLDWHYSPTSDEARLQILWQAWCWHGIDLDGQVECGDVVLVGTLRGGTRGIFDCLVEYGGTSAEWHVWRGRHTTDVIETF